MIFDATSRVLESSVNLSPNVFERERHFPDRFGIKCLSGEIWRYWHAFHITDLWEPVARVDKSLLEKPKFLFRNGFGGARLAV
jgi:hypothetical protein